MNMSPISSNSSILLSPLLPEELPPILSQRFRRKRYLGHQNMRSSETDLSSQSKLDQSKSIGSSSKKKDLQSVSSIGAGVEITTSLPAARSKPSPIRSTDDAETPQVEKTTGQVEAEAPLEYAPFPLRQKSSFSPASLTERQLSRLDPLTRSKYEAYQKPNNDILARVQESEIRAKKFIAEEHRKQKLKKEEDKKKWDHIHAGIEDPATALKGMNDANKAKDRMKMKLQRILNARVSQKVCADAS